MQVAKMSLPVGGRGVFPTRRAATRATRVLFIAGLARSRPRSVPPIPRAAPASGPNAAGPLGRLGPTIWQQAPTMGPAPKHWASSKYPTHALDWAHIWARAQNCRASARLAGPSGQHSSQICDQAANVAPEQTIWANPNILGQPKVRHNNFGPAQGLAPKMWLVHHILGMFPTCWGPAPGLRALPASTPRKFVTKLPTLHQTKPFGPAQKCLASQRSGTTFWSPPKV